MKLYSTPTTPFGRKITVALGFLGLGDQVTEMPVDTNDPNHVVRQLNPLGKIPTLVTADETIYDSRVILEFLDHLHGEHRLLPAEAAARRAVQVRAALIDGMMEAAILIVYETRFRPDSDKRSPDWLTYQSEKIVRGLLHIENSGMMGAYDAGAKPDMAAIGLACMLEYLDFRDVVAWRDHAPSLIPWLADFSASVPSFAASRPA